MFNHFVWLTIAAQSMICHGFVIQPKIIDGFVSNRSDFPYLINVYSREANGRISGNCGGSILNEK